MPTTRTRLRLALAAAVAALPALAAVPAQAAPAAPAHPSITYAECVFRDGASAEIAAIWFMDPGAKAVQMSVVRTSNAGGSLKVAVNRYAGLRGYGGYLPVYWYASGPRNAVLSVTIWDILGSQCTRTLS